MKNLFDKFMEFLYDNGETSLAEILCVNELHLNSIDYIPTDNIYKAKFVLGILIIDIDVHKYTTKFNIRIQFPNYGLCSLKELEQFTNYINNLKEFIVVLKQRFIDFIVTEC